MDDYFKTWTSIHRGFEIWLRNELRKACAYSDPSGRWDRMEVSLSEEKLQAFKRAARYSFGFHTTWDGDIRINEDAWEYHSQAAMEAGILLDGFDGVIGMMEDIHGVKIAPIPLFVIREWLQRIEDICLASQIARDRAIR